MSRARLTVVKPDLFEWDVFEMAAPIQSPAKCEVLSVIRFLSAKGERPAESHEQIVVVYGNVMNRQNVTKWCRELSEGRTDVHDEQRSRPYLISDDLLQEIKEGIRANRRVAIRELHHIIPEELREWCLTAGWLAPREGDSSRINGKVSSAWLPSYIKATRPVLEIFKMAGYFQDSPRMWLQRDISVSNLIHPLYCIVCKRIFPLLIA